MMIIVFPDDVTPATIYSGRLTSCFGCFYSMKTNVTSLKKTLQQKSQEKNKTLKNKTKENKVRGFSDR